MAKNNNIDIKISLIDQFSAKLKNITASAKTQLSGLDKQLQNKVNSNNTQAQSAFSQLEKGLSTRLGRASEGVNSSTSSLSNALNSSGATVGSALGMVASGIAVAGALAIAAFSKLYTDATEQNDRDLSNANTMSAMFGNSWAKSTEMVSVQNKQVFEIGNQEAINGSTLRDLFAGMSDTLAGTGGIDKDSGRMTDKGVEILKTIGYAAEAAKVNPTMSAQSTSKLIDQGQYGATRVDDTFTKNVGLVKAIEAQMKSLHNVEGTEAITDKFKDLTSEERATVIEQAGKAAFTQDYRTAKAGTVSNKAGNMQDALFSSEFGAFGFMRKVKTFDGSATTAFAEVGRIFDGIGKVAGTIGGVLSDMGFKQTDLMVNFVSNLKGFADGLIHFQAAILKFQGDVVIFRVNFETTFPGVIDGFLGFISAVQSTTSSFQSSFGSAYIQFTAGWLGWVFQAVQNIGAFAYDASVAIHSFWVSLTSAISSIVSTVVAGFQMAQGFVMGIGETINGAVQGVVSAFMGIFSGIQAAISSIQLPSFSMPSFPNPFAGKDEKKPGNAFKGQNLAQVGMVGNAFKGQNLDLFAAIQTEKDNMPTGANLTIANSSEIIIPKSIAQNQQQNNNRQAPINITVSNNFGEVTMDTADRVIKSIQDGLRQAPISMMA